MKTAVSSLSFSKNHLLLAELTAAGFEPKVNGSGRVLLGDELGRFLSGHEAAVIGTEIIDGSVLDLCPDLRFIAKYGVGLDNLDFVELAKRGIGVGFVAGVNRRSVAELVLGFILGHFRNIFVSNAGLRQGRWLKDGGRELSSLTIGLVGFGSVGTDVARLLAPFGPRVVFCDIVDKSNEARALGATFVPYPQILEHSDVVSFHVPGTPATRHMLSRTEVGVLSPHGLVINTSRGTVVDFDSVCEAVLEGKLGGFAADVFPVEPDDLSRFRDHPRLCFTPHIGGNSQEAVLAMGRAAIQKLNEWKAAGCPRP